MLGLPAVFKQQEKTRTSVQLTGRTRGIPAARAR